MKTRMIQAEHSASARYRDLMEFLALSADLTASVEIASGEP